MVGPMARIGSNKGQGQGKVRVKWRDGDGGVGVGGWGASSNLARARALLGGVSRAELVLCRTLEAAHTTRVWLVVRGGALLAASGTGKATETPFRAVFALGLALRALVRAGLAAHAA